MLVGKHARAPLLLGFRRARGSDRLVVDEEFCRRTPLARKEATKGSPSLPGPLPRLVRAWDASGEEDGNGLGAILRSGRASSTAPGWGGSPRGGSESIYVCEMS